MFHAFHSQSEDLSRKLAQSKECIKALENMLTNLVLWERPAEEGVEQVMYIALQCRVFVSVVLDCGLLMYTSLPWCRSQVISAVWMPLDH